MKVTRGPKGAMQEGLFWRLRMKLSNMSEGLTCLLRERHWSLCSEGGMPFSKTRMGISVRHRVGRKDNVFKTQIIFLTLG